MHKKSPKYVLELLLLGAALMLFAACSATDDSAENWAYITVDDSRQRLTPGANTQPRLEYCLALFLICAEKYSYFRIHEGYSANEDDRWMRWFPEYDKPLGPPEGPARREGPVYTRQFEHADVRLDIGKRQGKVMWK